VRARPGHPHIDHGRHRQGRRERDPVRNAEALERLGSVKAVVLDKTGTLRGKRRDGRRPGAGAPEEDDLLALVAAAERSSEHPSPDAIGARGHGHAAARPGCRDGLTWPRPGSGWPPWSTAGPCWSGGPGYLEAAGSTVSALVTEADALALDGKTPVFAAIDAAGGRPSSPIADTLKAGSAEAVAELRAAASP